MLDGTATTNIEKISSQLVAGLSNHMSVGNDSDYLCDVTILKHLLVNVNTELNHGYLC